MVAEEFLALFIKELEINYDLRKYYKLINHESRFFWRKAYLEQRLRYVQNNLDKRPMEIWDAGCGFATTAIFLALNGHRVTGNTLEFYFAKIKDRLKYWSQFGDLSGLHVQYANLFDMEIAAESFDCIIAQDTLHHLEPIDQAIDIFSRSLRPDGKLIVSEENGNSPFIRIKNFKQRGFKRISSYYDEQLGKTILFGNENARSLHQWEKILHSHGFSIPEKQLQYIRRFFPFQFNRHNYHRRIEEDQVSGQKINGIKETLYFSINFTACKKLSSDMKENLNDSSTIVEAFAGTAWEAALVKSLLDNAEIPAFMKDEIRGTTMPWQVSPGGFFSVKVMVRSSDFDLAKQVVDDFEANRRREDN